MAVWVVPAGPNGEREGHNLENSELTIGFAEMPDQSDVHSREHVRESLGEIHPEWSCRQLGKAASYLWNFKDGIQLGDLIVMPRKGQPIVAIGEMVGKYQYREVSDAESRGLSHFRAMNWISGRVPRDSLAKYLRTSLRYAPTTIFRPGSKK